jgi:pantetheine-phosphate adenylyltransferase
MSLCDELIIAIGINPMKTSMFTEQERAKQINTTIDREIEFVKSTNITVDCFQSLLVDYAKKIDATILIRGIRSVSDFEYEINIANINKVLAPNIETIFLPTSPDLAVVSSSMVKEVAKYGKDISEFVPAHIAKDIKDKFGFIKLSNKVNNTVELGGEAIDAIRSAVEKVQSALSKK